MLHDVPHEWPTAHLDHRFRPDLGLLGQARTLATRKDHHPHVRHYARCPYLRTSEQPRQLTHAVESGAPLVSIGLPTYNGARYIRELLESLVAQDYPNLEILVSDNASTDGTEGIVREVAARDSRVTFERLSANLGAAANFHRVLTAARGTYFMWASDHDLWDPRYVASAVEALEADPGAVLAYAHTMFIDAAGRELGIMEDELDLDQVRPVDRYVSLIWKLTVCNAIYGVMRLSEVRQTSTRSPMPSLDHLVLAELALRGRFLQDPATLYFRRSNHPPETLIEARRRQAEALDPTDADEWAARSPADYYRGLRDAHLRAVRRSRMSFADNQRAVAATYVCFSLRFRVSSRPANLLLRARRLMPPRLRAQVLGPT